MDMKQPPQSYPEQGNQLPPRECLAPTDKSYNSGFQNLGNPAVNSSQLLSEASIRSPGDLVELFAIVFSPVLDSCRGYDINSGPAGLPQALRDLVSDDRTRTLAWGALAVAGIPKSFNEAQRHALMNALLPYFVSGDEMGQAAVLRLAQEAADQRDYELYRVVGEACSAAPIDSRIIDSLAKSYCKLLCPNLQHDKALKIWSSIFAERASAETLSEITREILRRLYKGEKSSYDHLLTTLCNARDPRGFSLLKYLVNFGPTKIEPEWKQVLRQTFTPKNFVTDAITLTSIVLTSSVAEALVSTTVGNFVAVLGFFAWTVYARSRIKIEPVTHTVSTESEAFMKWRSYDYFVERLYNKLTALAPRNPRASALKEAMDNYPRYAHLKDAS